MSARVRIVALVVLAAAATAAVAVGGALLQGGGDDERTEAHARREPPALQLKVYGSGREATALRAAELAYETGDAAEARARFESILRRRPGSVEAAVGLAIASWPDGTIEDLRGLVAEHPDSGVVHLHLGLALFADGETEGAKEAWREAERRDPDSPAALDAESLLHPDMPPGRPFFIPAQPTPGQVDSLAIGDRLAVLRRRARTGGVRDWILYGAALQRVGRPLSARAAFDRALAHDPRDIEARTAAAVARFDKDDPSAAFSRLGPLARVRPRSPVVRFHLGYLLLWLGAAEEAERQLRLAVDAGPGTVHGREAKRLLSRLSEK